MFRIFNIFRRYLEYNIKSDVKNIYQVYNLGIKFKNGLNTNIYRSIKTVSLVEEIGDINLLIDYTMTIFFRSSVLYEVITPQYENSKN